MVLAILPNDGGDMIYTTNYAVAMMVEKCARGKYQRALARSSARWSGSDIENKWGARYAESRKNLHLRIVAKGLYTDEVFVDGKLFLVVGMTLDDVNDVHPEQLDVIWR